MRDKQRTSNLLLFKITLCTVGLVSLVAASPVETENSDSPKAMPYSSSGKITTPIDFFDSKSLPENFDIYLDPFVTTPSYDNVEYVPNGQSKPQFEVSRQWSGYDDTPSVSSEKTKNMKSYATNRGQHSANVEGAEADDDSKVFYGSYFNVHDNENIGPASIQTSFLKQVDQGNLQDIPIYETSDDKSRNAPTHTLKRPSVAELQEDAPALPGQAKIVRKGQKSEYPVPIRPLDQYPQLPPPGAYPTDGPFLDYDQGPFPGPGHHFNQRPYPRPPEQGQQGPHASEGDIHLGNKGTEDKRYDINKFGLPEYGPDFPDYSDNRFLPHGRGQFPSQPPPGGFPYTESPSDPRYYPYPPPSGQNPSYPRENPYGIPPAGNGFFPGGPLPDEQRPRTPLLDDQRQYIAPETNPYLNPAKDVYPDPTKGSGDLKEVRILGGHDPGELDSRDSDPLEGNVFGGGIHKGTFYPADDGYGGYNDPYKSDDTYGDGYGGGGGYSDPYDQAGYVDYTGNHIGTVTGIKVECSHGYSKSMKITVNFDVPFKGKIYAKGYYDTPHCSTYGTGTPYAHLTLPLDGCGMEEVTHDFKYGASGTRGYGVSYQTTIVVMFQKYTGVLEEWDKIFSVKCDKDELPEKVVQFGLEVPDVHATVVPTYKAKLPEVYLSVTGGKSIYGAPITSLYVGQRAALVVTASENSYYDVKVVNCYAHDGKNRNKLLLIDDHGCPYAKKLIGAIQKDVNKPSYGHNTYFAYFKAFKFPDNNNVYFQCSVRVCHHKCNVYPCPDYGYTGGFDNEIGYESYDGYDLPRQPIASYQPFRRKRSIGEQEEKEGQTAESLTASEELASSNYTKSDNETGKVEEDIELSRGITILLPGEEQITLQELMEKNFISPMNSDLCLDRLTLYSVAAATGIVIVILVITTTALFLKLRRLKYEQLKKLLEDKVHAKKAQKRIRKN